MKGYRPKIGIPQTKLQKIANVIGYGVIIVSTVYVLLKLSELPSQVPIHFNVANEPDGWGSSYLLLLLPLIGILVGLGLGAIEKRPHIHNYPDYLNEENVKQYYAISIRTANLVKNGLLIAWGIVQIDTMQKVQQTGVSLSIILMVVFSLAVAIPMISYIVSMTKIKRYG